MNVKRWYQSKTYWAAIIATLIDLADALHNQTFSWGNAFVIVMAVGQIVLRHLSTAAIVDKDDYGKEKISELRDNDISYKDAEDDIYKGASDEN